MSISEKTKHAIFNKSLMITVLSLLASALNFLVQAVLAARFGIGLPMDQFALATSAPLFVAGLLCASLSYVGTPPLARASQDLVQLRAVGTSLLGALITLGLIVAVGGSLVTAGVQIVTSLRDADSRAGLPTQLSILAWILAACQLIAALPVTLLNATSRPIAAASLSLLIAPVTVILLLGFGAQGIQIALAGMILGTLVAIIVGLSLGRRELLPPRFMRSEPALPLGDLRSEALWAVVALSCFSSFSVIDAYWTTGLDSGSLSTLSLAQRILVAVGSLVIVGPSALMVPRFAKMVQCGDGRGFRQTLLRSIATVGAVGTCTAFALFFSADTVVSLLFKRGAFDEEDVAALAGAISHYAPGFVGMLIGVILMRALFCLPASGRAGAAIGVSWSVLYFVFSGAMISRGLTGIVDAYSLSWIIVSGLLFWFVLRKSRQIGVADRNRTAAT